MGEGDLGFSPFIGTITAIVAGSIALTVFVSILALLAPDPSRQANKQFSSA